MSEFVDLLKQHESEVAKFLQTMATGSNEQCRLAREALEKSRNELVALANR